MFRYLSTIIILVVIILSPITAYSGPRLNNFTSYKVFAGEHQEYSKMMYNDKQGYFETHKFEMVYPEKEKKSMRLESLGISYVKGDLYFLEFPKKDDGLYVSFNSDGFLDAILIEVGKSRNGAVLFTWNEFVASLLAMGILPSSKMDQNEVIEVITGLKPYIDMHCTNRQNESFYIRIKDVHISSRPFYRIAIYRLS